VGVAGESSKPLKLAGAGPRLRVFFVAHWLAQKVTDPVLLRSPTTNDPPVL
jgi:hypothetical protein